MSFVRGIFLDRWELGVSAGACLGFIGLVVSNPRWAVRNAAFRLTCVLAAEGEPEVRRGLYQDQRG